ncbi:LytTR family DNA-binding domain-containing protein [Altererythrobacter sp. GH1-8]|uniref:LytTR family DNA-binding domain-containing protein n=1 Tax=Altererythrobacter sp. GH1-8 TaxID=3349333 RepID=UPI00374D96E4
MIDFSIWMSILLITSFNLPFYLLAALLTYLTLSGLRITAWPPAIALFCGGVAALGLGFLYTASYTWLISGVFPVLAERMSSEGVGYIEGTLFFIATPSGMSFLPIWIALHFVYEWGSKDVLFFPFLASRSVADARSGSADAERSIFLERVPKHLRRDIIAMAASEHYVDVYSQGGESKVLYRFGDAAREMERLGIGLRVHRSYWVAKNAITRLSGKGRLRQLDLPNGMTVPVSQAHLPKVQAIIDARKSDQN